MTDRHTNHLQQIREELDQSPAKNADEFILQLSKAGLLHAAGQSFPEAWQKMATTLLHTAGTQSGLSQLDQSLSEMLNFIFDMVDQASGEFLALGISQTQLSTFAIEGLETVFLNEPSESKNIHRSIIEKLTELEDKASHTHLDSDAVEHLQAWKEELPPVPEELMIPAIADILDGPSLKISQFMESAIHQLQKPVSETSSGQVIPVDFSRQSGSWTSERALVADAQDDDGTIWVLTDSNETEFAKVMHSRKNIWNVEVDSQHDVELILLNDQPMAPFENVPHLWTATATSRPEQVAIKLRGQKKFYVFRRDDSQGPRFH